MIAELQGASGLCNIIARLFIKFNSLLETACTHDVATDWCDCRSSSSLPEHASHQHVNTRPSSFIVAGTIVSLDEAAFSVALFGACPL